MGRKHRELTYTDNTTIPKAGDITNAMILGKKGNYLLYWQSCIGCGIGRWQPIQYTRPDPLRCKACSNKHKGLLARNSNPNPKGTIEQPIIGDIRYNDELGIKGWKSHRHIYVECPVCKKCRWMSIYQHKYSLSLGQNGICADCYKHSEEQRVVHADVNHGNWKGGIRNRNGYREVYITSDNPYVSMVHMKMYNGGGYVMEHRLVMAKHLERCLYSWEAVHHKNHIRDDNRVDNLEVMRHENHCSFTALEKRINKLEITAAEQSKVISLLLWHIKTTSSYIESVIGKGRDANL